MYLKALSAIAGISLVALIMGCTQSAEIAQPPPAVMAPEALVEPAPRAAGGETLTLFVGAASKPATEEAARLYAEKTGIKVEATFGGSGALLTQFSTEHYGDVFIPGSDDFMDLAEERDAILPETRKELVYLVPAILVARGNPKNVTELGDLAREDVRLVLAQPRVVCLGDVSEGILMEAGLWEQVRGNVASFGASCEDTLNMLLLGEADAIIAWDVYPRQQPEKVEAVELPQRLVRVRDIPAAVIRWSKQPERAQAFIDFLASEEGKAVFRKHHYTVEWTGEG